MTVVADLRAAIVRALEALDDGRPAEAEAFLRSALRRQRRRRYRCSGCGLTFMWPGELADHRRLSSCGEEGAA